MDIELKISNLRRSRMASGIPGCLLSSRAGMSTSRLSAIERGYVRPRAEEVSKLDSALRDLLEAREKVAAVAVSVGWPMA